MIGHTVIKFDLVESTNDVAKEFVEHDNSHGLVIVSSRQTKGRGRFGRIWQSFDDKGLYFSIILKKINLDKKLLPIAISISISKTIENVEPKLVSNLKWPNDVVVNNKKISGILIEMFNKSYIVGIGFNLNNDPQKFPPELANKATSLFAQTGRHYDKNVFLNQLFVEIDKTLNSSESSILCEAKKLSCTIGNFVEIKTPKTIIRGVAIDYAIDGSLIIKESNGKIKNITIGEVFDGY